MRRLLGIVALRPAAATRPVEGLKATLSHPDLWWGEQATVTVRSIDPCFDIHEHGSPGTAWVGVRFQSPPICYPAPAGPDGQWVYELTYDGRPQHIFSVEMFCLPNDAPDPNTGVIEHSQAYDALLVTANPRPTPTEPPAEEPPPVVPATPVPVRPNVTG